jgi:hypothetical protein
MITIMASPGPTISRVSSPLVSVLSDDDVGIVSIISTDDSESVETFESPSYDSIFQATRWASESISGTVRDRQGIREQEARDVAPEKVATTVKESAASTSSIPREQVQKASTTVSNESLAYLGGLNDAWRQSHMPRNNAFLLAKSSHGPLELNTSEKRGTVHFKNPDADEPSISPQHLSVTNTDERRLATFQKHEVMIQNGQQLKSPVSKRASLTVNPNSRSQPGNRKARNPISSSASKSRYTKVSAHIAEAEQESAVVSKSTSEVLLDETKSVLRPTLNSATLLLQAREGCGRTTPKPNETRNWRPEKVACVKMRPAEHKMTNQARSVPQPPADSAQNRHMGKARCAFGTRSAINETSKALQADSTKRNWFKGETETRYPWADVTCSRRRRRAEKNATSSNSAMEPAFEARELLPLKDTILPIKESSTPNTLPDSPVFSPGDVHLNRDKAQHICQPSSHRPDSHSRKSGRRVSRNNPCIQSEMQFPRLRDARADAGYPQSVFSNVAEVPTDDRKEGQHCSRVLKTGTNKSATIDAHRRSLQAGGATEVEVPRNPKADPSYPGDSNAPIAEANTYATGTSAAEGREQDNRRHESNAPPSKRRFLDSWSPSVKHLIKFKSVPKSSRKPTDGADQCSNERFGLLGRNKTTSITNENEVENSNFEFYDSEDMYLSFQQRKGRSSRTWRDYSRSRLKR